MFQPDPAKIVRVKRIEKSTILLVYFEGVKAPLAMKSRGKEEQEVYDNFTLGFWDEKRRQIYY